MDHYTDIAAPSFAGFDSHYVLKEWKKREGDRIRSLDIIAELESDEATVEIESYDDGILRCLVKEGDTVPVGSPIAQIAFSNEEYESKIKRSEVLDFSVALDYKQLLQLDAKRGFQSRKDYLTELLKTFLKDEKA